MALLLADSTIEIDIAGNVQPTDQLEARGLVGKGQIVLEEDPKRSCLT